MNMSGKVHVQFSDRDADVIWIDTECGMRAFGRFLQSFTVCALQRNRHEQYHHYQIEPPNFVGLPKTVDASHLSLLVGVRKDAFRCSGAARLHALYETVPTFLFNVLAQLCQ